MEDRIYNIKELIKKKKLDDELPFLERVDVKQILYDNQSKAIDKINVLKGMGSRERKLPAFLYLSELISVMIKTDFEPTNKINNLKKLRSIIIPQITRIEPVNISIDRIMNSEQNHDGKIEDLKNKLKELDDYINSINFTATQQHYFNYLVDISKDKDEYKKLAENDKFNFYLLRRIQEKNDKYYSDAHLIEQTIADLVREKREMERPEVVTRNIQGKEWFLVRLKQRRI